MTKLGPYERMRIVHVITRLILGGAQENTMLTCEGLADAARGDADHRPGAGARGRADHPRLGGGYRLIVRRTAMRREIHPLRDCASYRALMRPLRDLRPDVMHSIPPRRASWPAGPRPGAAA